MIKIDFNNFRVGTIVKVDSNDAWLDGVYVVNAMKIVELKTDEKTPTIHIDLELAEAPPSNLPVWIIPSRLDWDKILRIGDQAYMIRQIGADPGVVWVELTRAHWIKDL